jgi:hypothetical protein
MLFFGLPRSRILSTRVCAGNRAGGSVGTRCGLSHKSDAPRDRVVRDDVTHKYVETRDVRVDESTSPRDSVSSPGTVCHPAILPASLRVSTQSVLPAGVPQPQPH